MLFRLSLFSINTQVIIQNRAFWLVRYLGLSASNHFHEQNGCQSFTRFWWNTIFSCCTMPFLFFFLNNHLFIYTKTISRLRLSDYRWVIVNSGKVYPCPITFKLRNTLTEHSFTLRTWKCSYSRSCNCDHSRKRPALVTITFVKPRLNCHLNSVMKSSRKWQESLIW